MHTACASVVFLRSLHTKRSCDTVLRRQLGVDTVLVSQYGACSETCLPWQGRVYIDDVWGDSVEMSADGLAESRNGHRYMLPHTMRCVPCLKGS